MLAITLSILGGFIGLIVGGELLVRGASNLAAAFRVPPLIIGLTVVALGTSAPELAVSVQACFQGKTDLAVGNVVGSNLSNLLLILGAAALVAFLALFWLWRIPREEAEEGKDRGGSGTVGDSDS